MSYPLGDGRGDLALQVALWGGAGDLSSMGKSQVTSILFSRQALGLWKQKRVTENYESHREGQVLVRVTGWVLDRITCFVNFESNLEDFTNSQLIYLKDLASAMETLFPKTSKMKFKRGEKP